jgi:hypothetical protein
MELFSTILVLFVFALVILVGVINAYNEKKFESSTDFDCEKYSLDGSSNKEEIELEISVEICLQDKDRSP